MKPVNHRALMFYCPSSAEGVWSSAVVSMPCAHTLVIVLYVKFHREESLTFDGHEYLPLA